MNVHRAVLDKIKVYGAYESKNAYIIRDFLMRSVVTFDWIPVDSIDALRLLCLKPIPDHFSLPVLEMPSGLLLPNPTIEKIAFNLGWISKPKFDEYDVSIFGAGPAGLSAAVYAASGRFENCFS
jgi:thioredoxin reductase (NADPH)